MAKRAYSTTAGPVLLVPEWVLGALPRLVSPPLVVNFEGYDQSGELHLRYKAGVRDTR